MRILLISDIHANFPALQAVDQFFHGTAFDYIINCGDSVVYAPFPNETLQWLMQNKAVSILGNTDKKVIKLLQGGNFRKPSDPAKRIMYSWTADNLTSDHSSYLQSLKKKDIVSLEGNFQHKNKRPAIGIFHGSPAKNHEFLFKSTEDSRFLQLAKLTPFSVVVCGHSHSPFYKIIGETHFINPGSIGRMFDGDPRASCASIEVEGCKLIVNHHRIHYNIHQTIDAINSFGLPEIYALMYKTGRKTN